jgi:hypothetical protein
LGEDAYQTIINGSIKDTTRSSMVPGILNLTFLDFVFARRSTFNAAYYTSGIVKNNICRNIYIWHGGGESAQTLTAIPYFDIENNTVEDKISYGHAVGQIIGSNIVRNNHAKTILLEHGAVTSLTGESKPEYAYLIEGNTVSEGIECNQGGSPNLQYPDSVVKDYTIINILNNNADNIQLYSGAGYTYLVDNNTLQSGISDKSGGNWTTISNNTINNGRIVDLSGGTSFLENEIIEGNTIHFEATGDPDEDFAILNESQSATIRNNKITCTGAASGIKMISGYPSNIIGNEIEVSPDAEYGINTSSGEGVVTGNKIKGGRIAYHSSSGTILFAENEITNANYGFLSQGGEEVRNNKITHCNYGMVLNGLRGPISENVITDNDSIGIWIIRNVDMGGGNLNGIGRNITRDNGYFDMKISVNGLVADTLFINNNVWDHETIEDILQYDILNESTGGKLFVDLQSIIALPANVELTEPANLSTIDTTKIILNWTESIGAESYQLQLSTDENFNTIVLDTTVQLNNFSVDNLAYNTEYFWRVIAKNLAGESDWSEKWQFKTKIATGIKNTKADAPELNIYPNPAQGKFRVQMPVRLLADSKFRVEQVIIEVYDLNGRKCLEKNIPSGAEDFEVDVSGFGCGLYFCKVSFHNSSEMKKLIIQK